MTNKINLYVDGPQLNEIQKNYGIEIDGYTFNPSLFKKMVQLIILNTAKKF